MTTIIITVLVLIIDAKQHVSQLENVLILADDLPRSGLVHSLPFLNSFSLQRNKHKAHDVYDNVLFF